MISIFYACCHVTDCNKATACRISISRDKTMMPELMHTPSLKVTFSDNYPQAEVCCEDYRENWYAQTI